MVDIEPRKLKIIDILADFEFENKREDKTEGSIGRAYHIAADQILVLQDKAVKKALENSKQPKLV